MTSVVVMVKRKSAEPVVVCSIIRADEGVNSMLDPNYIVGFVDGEGCFCITVNKNGSRLPEVRLIFEIELREDDEAILEKIKATLGCGNIYRLEYEKFDKWQPHVKYKVSNFSDIRNKIIPFFRSYPLQAKKKLQFEKFCEVAEMIERKEHLTATGIARIGLIRHRDSLDALDTHVQWGAIETT